VCSRCEAPSGNLPAAQAYTKVSINTFVQWNRIQPCCLITTSREIEQLAQEIGMASRQTVIVTGASQGIGAAVTQAFLDRGYNVVGNSRTFSNATFKSSPALELVEGDIGLETTAQKITQTAIKKFGSIDHVVTNAGIFWAKPFTDYTADELRSFVSTNLQGFIFVTQLAVKQILAQGTAGSVTSITASWASNPIAGIPASIPMITKGGLNSGILSLAIEYAKSNIRFNAVAPGIVDTPMHATNPKDFLKTLSPMGTISDPKEIADAVVYLTEARNVTGEVLHVDGGAHNGRW
jgi:NAD(P)-dependent dehydrogenase (short-subunit alcohol dehydrogenase family)